MASGIFTVLDDIAALMDDIAITSKVATRKTAAILGDDLAVNAEKATGFLESRELPVIWAITKGSLLNKLIIVPIALLLNAFLPRAIDIALIVGGVYLAYEGAEKVIEFIFHRRKKGHEVVEKSNESDGEREKTKVRQAITTDFILSVEIVVIALGTVSDQEILIQVVTVSIVSLIATVGVYGLVALIVRMDDAGTRLIQKSEGKGLLAKLGATLVKALPMLIKALGVIGTIALLLVSGGIFVHNIEYMHHILAGMPSLLREMIFGLAIGLVALGVSKLLGKIFRFGKR